jgi:hypothetical protein
MKIFSKINYSEEVLFENALKKTEEKRRKKDMDKEEDEKGADKVETG